MTVGTRLQVIDKYLELVELQERAIRRTVGLNGGIEILEAGCGRSWPFKLEGVEYRLTGIDLDADALQHRMDVERDLHKGLVGDLRTVSIQAESFDVIYCSYVLEHIPNPSVVLSQFMKWLRPGGSIIIKIPDPRSAHGFITKVTPHWFHVLFYRYIVGYKEAGQPGHGPYETFYDVAVSRPGIREFCRLNGLSVELEVGIADMAKYGRWKRWIVRSARRMISVASFGSLSSRHGNLLFVLAKPAYSEL